MRQSSRFFIFNYFSEAIDSKNGSFFFLLPSFSVITKSRLLFYDGKRVTECCLSSREKTKLTSFRFVSLFFYFYQKNCILSSCVIKCRYNDKMEKEMDFSKVNAIFQAFHFDANVSPVNLDLPIIFQRRYDFANLVVAEQEFLLMAEKRSGSLDNFVKQAQAVQRQIHQNVILVFRQLADDDKKKLLQARLSYLDYQENAYLPQLGFLYSKISDTKKIEKELTPTEQRILIILLLFVSDLVIDIDKISQLSGLAVPSLYRIFKSYKERGWLTNQRKSYQLAKTKVDLFNEAKILLKNPITEVVIISDEDFQRLKADLDFKISHVEALSYLGMLANTESYGQYTLSKKQFKKVEKTIKQPIFQGHRIEIWTYEPIVFDYNSDTWMQVGVESNCNMVDPISLYLTLKDNDDPRIMEEVEELKEKIYMILGEKYAG